MCFWDRGGLKLIIIRRRIIIRLILNLKLNIYKIQKKNYNSNQVNLNSYFNNFTFSLSGQLLSSTSESMQP